MDARFEVLYRPLEHAGRYYAFPCDACGRVELDVLTEKERNNYLFARAMVGRMVAPPTVVPKRAQ